MKLVWGYLGYGNYGDELLANIVINQLQEQELDVLPLSSKHSFLQHLRLFSKADSLIAVGGLFQDKTSFLCVFYYSAVVFIAKIMGLEIILLSQGIGPLRSSLARCLTILAFRLADKISVRDQVSAAFLHKHCIKYILAPDLAWAQTIQSQDNIERTNIIFAFRQEDLELLDISKIKNILSAYSPEKYSLAYLNMQAEDAIANKIISQKLQLNYPLVDIGFDKIFTSAQILLGTRLHALILAKNQGVEICNPKDLVSVSDDIYYKSSFGQKTAELFYWLENYSLSELSTMAAGQLSFIGNAQ